MPDDIALPCDAFEESQKPKPIKKDNEMRYYQEKSLGGGKIQSAKQFLDNDRKVLRFYTNANGLPYVVQYYLADDTVEIRECHQPNDGRDSYSIRLRRMKLPDNIQVN